MKSSEVLLAALERMDGGKKWARSAADLNAGDKQCTVTAIDMSAADGHFKALNFLKLAVGIKYVVPWNDSAADFSVIEKGFRAAIALAIAEGD